MASAFLQPKVLSCPVAVLASVLELIPLRVVLGVLRLQKHIDANILIAMSRLEKKFSTRRVTRIVSVLETIAIAVHVSNRPLVC